MAKSKNGGTRAYIRGRIGSDVYSVGKTADGKKQQVVRSLAESVMNPRTSGQMFGRMIMSTVMQAVSALKPIIDHSFDGLPSGQPCISEFIRLNYALVKADATAHPSESNTFGLNMYQEKGAKAGCYQLSKGNLTVPRTISLTANEFDISLSADAHTVGDLKSRWGAGSDGYITLVGFVNNRGYVYTRLHINPALADTTEISAENVSTLFVQEGTMNATISFADNMVKATISTEQNWKGGAFILSAKQNGSWIHSTATIKDVEDVDYASDVALPTYPVGSEQFLNGGDI